MPKLTSKLSAFSEVLQAGAPRDGALFDPVPVQLAFGVRRRRAPARTRDVPPPALAASLDAPIPKARSGVSRT